MSSTSFYPISSVSPGDILATVVSAIPVEAITFFAAAAVSRLFIAALSAPLAGIGIGIVITKLALKSFSRYDSGPLVYLTKEACRFNRKYPQAQLISFIFVLSIGFLSAQIAMIAGGLLGCFGAILLDVETYRLIQQANRRRR